MEIKKDCKAVRNRFSDLGEQAWELLVAQQLSNYGPGILDLAEIDLENAQNLWKQIPKDRIYLMEEFRDELCRRRKI